MEATSTSGVEQNRPSGPAMAAVVSAAIGTFVLGLFTTLAEASTSVKDSLVFRKPVGPLSGKTTVAVAAWILCWAVLSAVWKRKEVDFRKTVVAAIVLVGLGILGTFPTFFEQFAAE